ncbi:MAG: hypothetical protein IPN69_09220 [Acidobacteria bacterium]|nr:hypothetical protein [Acidobacteriota bacterium]MBK8810895.1 hypothetical protein [Acidobacteriota bacterium]
MLEATPKVFQVWSSVLGSNLVTIGGYTGGTKVFAGGTLIGTANANSGSRWTTADPVTGTTVRWAGSNGVGQKAAEETEPLGQLIWANYDMLRSESNNPKFGLTEGQRKTIIGEEKLNGQAITIFELPGPVLTFFKPNAFFDQGSFPTAEVIAHEAIHEVGVRTDTAIRLFLPPVNTGIPNPFAAHDLSSYPYYNDIIESCSVNR